MPANLTPQYLEAESRYRESMTEEEKLAALEDMYALLPKHKGTDKIQADIKRRISLLKKKGRSRPGAPRDAPYRVTREGSAQVLLLGPPNSGKSTVAAALSGVPLKSAAYPFTTRLPQVAMMPYLDVQIQLVDLPPITAEFCTYWQINLARTADLLLLIIDLGRKDVWEKLEGLLAELRQRRVEPAPPAADPVPGVVYQTFFLLGNKADREEARGNREVLPELLPPALSLHPFSALRASPPETEKLKAMLWERLGLIRIYSKPQREKADLEKPFTLSVGGTILDFARQVHKDFGEKFESARIWGSGKFPGQTVGKEHVLHDGDIVELHVSE